MPDGGPEAAAASVLDPPRSDPPHVHVSERLEHLTREVPDSHRVVAT